MKKLLKNGYALAGLVVVVVIALIMIFRGGSGDGESVTIKRGGFVRTVSLSGKVVATQSVDLSFETGGTVAVVAKKAGDEVSAGQVIASLNASDVVADRDKAVADLEAARAELLKLKDSGSSGMQTDIEKRKLVNSIIDAYTKSDDAVHNKVDQYFRGGYLDYPTILYKFYSYAEKEADINYSRVEAERTLKKFSQLVSGLTVETFTTTTLADAKQYLADIKKFLDNLAPAVNTFYVGVNELTQTSADKYKSDLATARFNINESIEAITSYESDVVGSVSDIAVREAKVSAAEATVRGYDAELGKMTIRAPFSGVISKQDAKVGQAVSAHSVVASLISRNLEVEVFVPEISLPGIAVGDRASVVFDAYPDTRFDASVIHIDPAETIRDGVSSYKVRLSIENADDRILSGLTADVFIETEKKSDVLSIPVRSVMTTNGKMYVYKKVGEEYVKTEVTLGPKDGKGNVEVITGVAEGDIILLSPEQ